MSVMKDDNPLDHVLAPSAGQDTERLRDEPGRTHASSQVECDIAEVIFALDGVVWADALDVAAALLDGPLRQLIAERDEARAQVQRVRALCEKAERREAASSARMFDGTPFPEHIPRVQLRRALDEP